MIPGPKSRQLARRLRKVESRNVTYVSEQFPVFWESASGARVRDVDHRRYLDLSSAFGVAALGHSSPVIRQALQKQARLLWHGMGDIHPSAVKVELLEQLAAMAPGDLSQGILSSSGAEAVEAALKTACLLTGKPGIIAFEGAYHGLTYGTLTVTDRAEFTSPFSDQISNVAHHFPYPDSLRGPSEEECLERVEVALRKSSLGKTVGAILVEPVQGRGGVRVPKPSFLQGLRQLADRYGLLLIADEIFTGLGRTGCLWAVEHAGVLPDLLCVGKALGGGFPISVCLGSPEVMQAWPESDGEAIHTSTFLGNPLGCAMALASLREIKKKHLAERAAQIGAWWKKELVRNLGGHPQIGEIRGIGLMIGIELVQDRSTLRPDSAFAAQLVLEGLQRGLILLSGGKNRNVLTLTPPLTITEKELARATAILKELLNGKTRRKN